MILHMIYKSPHHRSDWPRNSPYKATTDRKKDTPVFVEAVKKLRAGQQKMVLFCFCKNKHVHKAWQMLIHC